ncbi:hypothetical protein THMIRHAS_14600 [Thiosulfatimonas sediminis]|uniref:Lipoprotein n=1 Tax=Thiosulfatimonas sediminis TaxID=2675054 RepID=A0A6F8PVM0_9GAMM|nr:hypothetical protein [Thiosulfatimonas sediminis]BBP46087.1 hypothetical protein THMIRHAS_14600 [Thiosulfatimonas sediminis]
MNLFRRAHWLIFLLSAGLLTLNACTNQETASPENTVTNYYSALQTLDMHSAYQRLSEHHRPADSVALGEQLQINDDIVRLELALSTVSILSVEQNGHQANVQIQLQRPQIQAFDLLVPEIKANLENGNYAAVEERMRTLIAQQLIALNTDSHSVQLSQQNGVWLINAIR